MSVTGSWTECRTGAWLGQISPSESTRSLGPDKAAAGRMRGFTLLEILVVMFIVGLMFSLAVLSVGDGGQRETVRREAERFRALVLLAQERAILEAREFGVSFTDDGYSFLVLEDNEWQPITDDELFRERTLPEGMGVELTADDLPVDLAAAEEDENEKGPRPHLLVLSSGELSSFELSFYAEHGDIAYRIEGEVQGEVSLQHDEDAL